MGAAGRTSIVGQLAVRRAGRVDLEQGCKGKGLRGGRGDNVADDGAGGAGKGVKGAGKAGKGGEAGAGDEHSVGPVL